MKLHGLRVLVTGGARRIGRGICLHLAEHGAKVIVHYRSSAAEAREVASRCGGTALAADLSAGQAECERLIERAGGIDVLVNNASAYEKVALEDLDEATLDRALAANLKGPFFLARAAGLKMRGGAGGAIVNLTDWAALRPYPGYLAYFAAKAGLLSLTAGLARELAPTVRVNAVAPGPILLPEGAPPGHEAKILQVTPLGRLGGPEAVAQAVRFLIEDDFVTGQTVVVDGGRSLR